MQKPAIPDNETERIKSLIELDLLDTPLEESFERLIRITKALFKVPIVSFTLIDSERQWFKSSIGLENCETSRDESFCAHAINQEEIFIVNDATKDPRFFDNPSVINSPKIRFYAGYPIKSQLGFKIGTICIADSKSHHFTNDDLEYLKDIGTLIETEIAVRKSNLNHKQLMKELKNAKRAQLIDNLTRLWNRGGLEKWLVYQAELARNENTEFGIALIDIDNFKLINDQYGHCAGNAVLCQVSKRMLSGFRELDLVGRWGGEEFLAIINSFNRSELYNIAERVRKDVCKSPVVYENASIPVSITIGLDIWTSEKSLCIDDMVSGADVALYKGKNSGKNKVICNFDSDK